MIALDRSSREPLHRQLHFRLAEAIRDGEIDGNTRLPSTRMLARALAVSRNSVLTAYETLAAEGIIRGERGSGMWVSDAARVKGMRVIGLRRAVRESQYPDRIIPLTDPDGNPIYLNY